MSNRTNRNTRTTRTPSPATTPPQEQPPAEPGLPVLAICDNHNPAHLATTMQQMSDITKQHKCTGWRVTGG